MSLADAPIQRCIDCSIELPLLPPSDDTSASCSDCGSTACGWRDRGTGRWSEQIEQDGQAGAWITAQFDTNYDGELQSQLETAFSPRSYQFSMRGGRAWNMQRVEVPPALAATDGNVPLRFWQIGPVTMALRDVEVGPERLYSLLLHDVRLHEWEHASIEGQDRDAMGLVGRLWGTIYARLDQPAPIEQMTPPAPAPPVATKPLAVDGPLSPKPGMPAEPFAHCGNVPTLHPPRFEGAPKSGWSIRLAELWRRFQPAGFLRGRVWWWLMLVCLCVGVTSRFPAVIGIVVLFVLHRLLARAILPLALRQLPANDLGRAMPWLGSLAAFWIVATIISALLDCRAFSPVPLVLLILLLLATGLYRLRFAGAMIGLATLILLIFTFQHAPLRCGEQFGQVVSRAVTQVPARLDAVAPARKSDTDIVAEQATPKQGARVSIDQALAEPRKYFHCGDVNTAALPSAPPEIYFGESSLFDFRQSVLKATADAQMRKIVELIQTYPAAHIVLTGHSDKTGAPLPNMKLSEGRAQSVANWLVDQGAIPRAQVDVRGAGDRYPLVDDAALFRLNRRVEMRIDCASEATP
jgi:outer membrane protein OmpA-like peptidoglycan-associated protein